ncbi:MAG: T9SS type A sorting domain-containing protein [Bacteroidia bacterium]|nr:T9SS type A sorting domain-containing protein [Bacteroidia bacterium]
MSTNQFKSIHSFILLAISFTVFSQSVSTVTTGLGSSLGGIIMDNAGNKYVSIRSTNEIKKIDPAGNITVYCNSGLNDPMGLAFDSQGKLYVANYSGQVTVIPPGGGNATNYTSGLSIPFVIKQYDADTLIVQEYMSKNVYKILPGGGAAGTSSVPLIATPSGGTRGGGLGVYPNKDILIINVYSFYAYRLNPSTLTTTLISGPLSYDPIDISIGQGNQFYFANWGGHTIEVLDGITGLVTNYAGTGVAGGLDGGISTAQFNNPYYICNDPLGVKYLTESSSGKIRKISTNQCSINNLNLGSAITACAGSSVLLNANYQTTFYANSTYTNQWAGPNGYNSTNLTNTITNVSTLNNGYYVFSAKDVNGCIRKDSVLLTVTSINNSVSVTGNTLICNQSNATYQWVNCATNYSPISGATSQTYSPLQNGNYAVIINYNSCSDTSACNNFVISAIKANTLENKLELFPNPANDVITISLNTNFSEGKINIIDVNGKCVYTAVINNRRAEADVRNLTNGLYFVQLSTDDGTIATKKLVITK